MMTRHCDDAADPLPLVRPAQPDRVHLRRRRDAAAPRARRAGGGVGRLRLPARQPVRAARRAVVARRRLPAAGSRCAATRARTTSSAARAPGATRCRGDARVTQPFRLAAGRRRRPRAAAARSSSTARATKATPATRSPRRCSPTACTSSAAASSTTGRAASSAPAPRSPTRSCSSARGARTEPNARATTQSSSTTGSSPRARTAGRRCASTSARVTDALSPLPAGGLLLQDVHVAADAAVVAALRARHPPRRGHGTRAPSEPDPDRYEHQYAHCDVLVIGGGPAGLAAALRGGARAARA